MICLIHTRLQPGIHKTRRNLHEPFERFPSIRNLKGDGLEWRDEENR